MGGKEMVEFFQTLLWIDTTAVPDDAASLPVPKKNYEAFVNAVRKFAEKEGFQVDIFHAPEGSTRHGARMGNILIAFDCGAKETIAIIDHWDKMPYDANHWSKETPPLRGVIVADRLYGRGASDNIGGFIAAFQALRELKESGKSRVNIDLWLTWGEEKQCESGLHYVVNNKVSGFGSYSGILMPDVAPDPIMVGSSGVYWNTATCKGTLADIAGFTEALAAYHAEALKDESGFVPPAGSPYKRVPGQFSVVKIEFKPKPESDKKFQVTGIATGLVEDGTGKVIGTKPFKDIPHNTIPGKCGIFFVLEAAGKQEFADLFGKLNDANGGKAKLLFDSAEGGKITGVIEVKGKPAHSSRPYLGENALLNAIPYLKGLAAYGETEGEATLGFDMRIIPERRGDGYREAVRNFESWFNAGVRPKFKRCEVNTHVNAKGVKGPVVEVQGSFSDPNAALAQLIARKTGRSFGAELGGTDASIIEGAGVKTPLGKPVPTVLCGCEVDEDNGHGDNESVSLNGLAGVKDIIVYVAENWENAKTGKHRR